MWRFLIGLLCFLPALLCAQVRFSADFESGAFGRVVSKKDSVTYTKIVIENTPDPVNCHEPKNQRSSRWMYFLMSGVKGDSIVMDIKGSDALRAMYSYDNFTFERFTEEEFDKSRLHKRFERDSIYIAYFTPYTYSHLQHKIALWSARAAVQVDTIGYSANGLPLQVLRITDGSVGDATKKGVWVQARVHPSESPSSFVLEGFVDRLLRPDEQELLKTTVFYVMPMANPDGVVKGLSRTDARGIDHEGNYDSDSLKTAVEVVAIKSYLTSLFDEEQGVELFLNIHAQVAGKSSYWIHTAESSSNYLYNQKRLISAHTELFPQKKRGNDGVIARRDRVPEGWVFNQWGDGCVAVTFEVPYTFYSSRDRWVDTANLAAYGADMVDVAANAVGEATSKSIIIDDTIRRRGWDVVSEGIHYGNAALKARKRSAKAVFETPELSVGQWSIYRWSVEREAWEPFDEIEVKKTKSFPIGIKATEKNELLDAIMIRKNDSK